MASNHKKNWSDKKRIEVVTCYLALGKAPMVEAVTGVPRQTIRIWKMQQWWKDLEKEILQDEEQELDAKLSKIIDKSLDAVTERIQNGEFILDSRTGTIKRVPVRLRDVHKVAIDLVDKRNLIRGKPTSITERISTEDVIRKLAEEFKSFIKGNDERIVSDDDNQTDEVGLQSGLGEDGKEPEQIEFNKGSGETPIDANRILQAPGKVNYALYEKWPSRLQNREPQIQLASPDEETKSGAEQGSPATGTEDGAEHNDGRGSYSPVEQGREQYPFEPESTQPPQESFIQAAK